MTVLLGGRSAECIVFGDVSTGAADDLAKATVIARSMVTTYGMSDRLGPVTYEAEQNTMNGASGQLGLNRTILGNDTVCTIDSAVRELVEAAQKRALSILGQNQAALNAGAQELLLKETLTQEELKTLLVCHQANPIVNSDEPKLLKTN